MNNINYQKELEKELEKIVSQRQLNNTKEAPSLFYTVAVHHAAVIV